MQRFALLGAGFIGSVHAANLAAHPDVDFSLVFDVDHDRAKALAATHGARAAADLAEVFDSAAIDAVFIASSTDTHASHLRRAAEAGLAVLCEKPIDLDLGQAGDTAAFATKHAVRVMVDFNRRFDQDNAELKRIVDAGEIGAVELIQLTSRGPAMPPLPYIATSGGQMRDQAVHFFDLVRWLTGTDPVEVFATGSALAEPRLAEYGDVDTSVVSLRLPGGALVQIDCARRTGYGYDERIEIMGSEGMAEAGRHRTGAVSRYHSGKVVTDGMHPGWFERVQPTYAAALGHFVAGLENGTAADGGSALAPSLEDGLKAQAIAEAATLSLRTGRTEKIQY
ncbi:Gfo/Idh/MocA family oxidoreductase [Arthrobacter sp. NPDC058097]|uniref:Gfo/Idh/MocA family protein n=1 Tax=Arthrobacter sp. NPDC058097 TaxID=3346340 RepID=UPI0036D82D9D